MGLDLLPQLALNGLVLGTFYAVLGLAMALILGVTGRFHFAFSASFTLAAFVAAVLSTSHGLFPVAALVVAVVVAAVSGVLIEVFIYRPLARRAGNRALLAIFVSSLGIAIAGRNLIQLVWATNSTSVPFDLVRLDVISLPFDLTITRLDLISTAVLLILAFVAVAVLRWTVWGQIVRGVRGNPTMAAAVGIRPEVVFVFVFAASSAAAGLAATLTAARLAATPSMGNDALFTSFVVAFLAGTRAPALRVVLVGIGLGLVQSISGLWIPSNLTNLVVFGLLFGYLTLQGTGALRLFGLQATRA